MPTVAEKNGYRFFFYSNEGTELPHVHVEKGGNEAKFWLVQLHLADNDGFPAHELQKIHALVKAHRLFFLAAYRKVHGT